MIKFMKKFPAGTLLIPMLASALINTIFPNLYASLTGSAAALFTDKSTGFMVGVLSLVSGAMLDLNVLKHVLKKQGVLIILKLVIVLIIGTLLIKLMGYNTVFGLSAVAIMVGLVSTNPAAYLAIVSENGSTEDEGAFSILGILSLPIFPILVYTISFGGEVPYISILHALIPILVGFVIGNLDKEFVAFTSPAIAILMPFLGWSLGANINLLDAIVNGYSGIFIVLLIYLLITIPSYIFERSVLKSDGISAIAINIVAGVSLAAPKFIAEFDPNLESMLPAIVAQLTFAVVLSSVLTPIICRKLKK